MICTTVFLALAALGAASLASAEDAHLNQLETARLTQAAQRVEFGVQGDNSAFKFRFADPVWPLVAFLCACLLRDSEF
jgi:hypothetical protein